MDDRKVWSRDLEKSNKPARLVGLMTWMTAEMKSRMRATAPLRTGGSSHTIHHVAVFRQWKRKQGQQPQMLDLQKPSTLDRQVSEIFGTKSRRSYQPRARKSRLFQLSEKAGRYHKITTCSRRRQCPEIQNGIQCKQYHHPLFSKFKLPLWITKKHSQ